MKIFNVNRNKKYGVMSVSLASNKTNKNKEIIMDKLITKN